MLLLESLPLFALVLVFALDAAAVALVRQCL